MMCGWCGEPLRDRCRPEKAGELARDRDDTDFAALAALTQALVELEAVLGAPGDLQHVDGLAFGGERPASL